MKRDPKKTLENVLQAIELYWKENDRPPTIREIMKLAGLKSTSHTRHCLKRLEEDELISLDPFKSRGIRLLDSIHEGVVKFFPVRVAGRIVAGEPIHVPGSSTDIFDSETNIDVPLHLIPPKTNLKNLFALEVQGDSMIDAMISDGDTVIMMPPNNYNNGDMVAVWLSDSEETTLKRIYTEKKHVRLQPANPAYKPKIIPNDTHIEVQGKVVAVIRKCW